MNKLFHLTKWLAVASIFYFSILQTLCQPEILNDGLVAYYPLNGNANDYSGKNNNGLPSNVFWAPRDFGGQSLQLPYANSAITVQPSAALNIDTNITITSWIRLETNQSGGIVIARGVLGSYWNYGLVARADSFGYMKSSGNGGVNTRLNDGRWHQIATVVSEPANRLVCYLDGVPILGVRALEGSFDVNKVGNIVSDTGFGGGVFIGRVAANSAFQGLIDDIRIYNRALSDSEIKALYSYESTPAGTSFITNGLVAYYPFDGNENDESGNSNNGTLQNGPTFNSNHK